MHAFTHMSHVLLTILMDLPCWNHSIFHDHAIASSSIITLLFGCCELVNYLWSKSLITCSYDNQRDCGFGEAATFKASLRRQWQPTPVLLPGKSHGRRSLVGCSPWGRWGLDTTELFHFHFSLSCIGEGNGNPLQCSCLENRRDGGAWWTAVYGVAQNRTWLKWLSSSLVADSSIGKKENQQLLAMPGTVPFFLPASRLCQWGVITQYFQDLPCSWF